MPSFKSIAALAALSAAPLVLAHGTVSGVVSGGKWYAGTTIQWVYMASKPDVPGWYSNNQDNGYVEPASYANADIICHKNATVGGTPIPMAAGDSIDLQWTVWPDSHKGPVITYMAPVDGEFSAVEKGDLQWFKVAEAGYDASTWATDTMIANNNTATFTVPSTLKAGNYVVRNEIIALHSAGQENGAQNYPQCLNVAVTGSGSEVPSGTVGTALYKSTDPGVLINIYTDLTSYTIPGPAMSGSKESTGNSSSSSSSSSATSSSSSSSSSFATSTTSISNSSIASSTTSSEARVATHFCA